MPCKGGYRERMEAERLLKAENARLVKEGQDRDKDFEQYKIEKEKEREDLKDYYEQRSYRRKDATEDHKFFYAMALSAVSLIVGVVGAVINVMGKSKALALAAMAFV